MFDSTDKYFLWSALASILASISLWFLYDHSYGLFVGLWAPSILALWVGTRLVLLSDQAETLSTSTPKGGDSQ